MERVFNNPTNITVSVVISNPFAFMYSLYQLPIRRRIESLLKDSSWKD